MGEPALKLSESFQVFHIYGLYCQSCVRTLEKLLSEKLTSEIRVDFGKSLLYLDSDDISLEKLNALIKPFGYFATSSLITETEEHHRESLLLNLWSKAVVGLVLSMWQVLLNLALFAFDNSSMTSAYYRYYIYASVILFAPVAIYSSAPIYRMAWAALKLRTINMDLFLTIEILACIAVSIIAGMEQRAMYLDSLSMALSFFILAKALLYGNQLRSETSVGMLLKSLPNTVLKVDRSGGEKLVEISRVRPGHLIKVSSDSKIPFDGTLLSDHARIDQSQLTGEEDPVLLKQGSIIYAGSKSIDSSLLIEVTQTIGSRYIDQIVTSNYVSETNKHHQSMQPPRYLGLWMKSVLIFSAMMFVWRMWFWNDGLISSIAWASFILIALCPCVFFNSLPISYACLKKKLTKSMIQVNSVQAIMAVPSIRGIFFDKTGTLTIPKVVENKVYINPNVSMTAKQILEICSLLEKDCSHPIARALQRSASPANWLELNQISEVPGMGIAANTKNQKVLRIGSKEFVSRSSLDLPSVDSMGVWLATNEDWIAYIPLTFALMPQVPRMVKDLRTRFSLGVLTGDSKKSLKSLDSVVEQNDFIAFSCTPDDKATIIRNRQTKSHGIMYVGEGVNDSTAMSVANIAVATRGAPTYVRCHADIEIQDVTLLPYLVESLQSANRIVKQNTAASIVYNAAAIGFLLSGFFTPHLVVLLMASATLFIVLNSFRAGTLAAPISADESICIDAV